MQRVLVVLILALSVFSFSIPFIPKAHAVSVSIDGKNTFTCTVSSTTQSVTFSTSNPNDLLLFAVEYVGTVTITGVSDGHLSWTTRLNGGNSAVKLGEFYAVWSGSGSETITVTFGSATSSCALLGFGVTGIDQVIPFDGTAQGTSSTSASSLAVSVTTSHVTDVIVGLGAGASGAFTFAPGSGYTSVDVTTAKVYSEYQAVTGTQSGFTVGVSRNGLDAMAVIGDALCASPCAPVITRVNPSGGQAQMPVEVDGQAFTSLTSITFCSVNAPTFTFISDTVINVISPAVPLGTAICDIQITTSLGSSSTSTADQFTYLVLGGRSPNPVGLSSVTGPGGVPIPPQLADQNVLSLMGILSGIILLSSVPRIEKQKKKKDSFI